MAKLDDTVENKRPISSALNNVDPSSQIGGPAPSGFGVEEDAEEETGNVRGSRRYETRDRAMEMERVSEDREITEDRTLSDEEFSRRINESDGYAALPKPPQIPGFHLKWATTQGQVDNVRQDLRYGYTPVKSSEMPSYFHDSIKSGHFEGCVGHNEMILMKIENRRYQELMVTRHHRKPLEMEGAVVDKDNETLTHNGKSLKVDVEEGTANFVKRRKESRFE